MDSGKHGTGGGKEKRFSGRAEAYDRSRASYPFEAIDAVIAAAGLRRPGPVADIGSGTGLLTALWIARRFEVAAVEPNADMRRMAEEKLGPSRLFRSVAGTGESTTLTPSSVAAASIAQAFHWMDAARVRDELRRVLRPGGMVALIWNSRRSGGTPFLEDYERFLREWGTDYLDVASSWERPEPIERLYGHRPVRRSFENPHWLDRDGLVDLVGSSSYMPGDGDPRHAAMRAALERLFHAHAPDGRVRLDYDTIVYCDRLR